MLSVDVNIKPGPNTVGNNKIPLNILWLYKWNKSTVPFVWDSFDCYQGHDNSEQKFLKKGGLLNFHLNFNSLLPEIDEICFIAKQSNISDLQISDPKLDSSLFNNE